MCKAHLEQENQHRLMWKEMICLKSYGSYSQNLAEINNHPSQMPCNEHFLTPSYLLFLHVDLPTEKKDKGIKPFGMQEYL